MNTSEFLRSFRFVAAVDTLRSAAPALFGGSAPSASRLDGPLTVESLVVDGRKGLGVALALSCGALLLFAGNASAQGTLLSGLESQDIGTEDRYALMGMGSAEELAPGNFDMVAGGADIWDNADGFHFAYEQMNTPFLDLRVQVPFLEDGVDHWSKAGIMVREDLTPGSRHAMVVVTPAAGQNVWTSQYRSETDGASGEWSSQVGPVTYPNAWIRLTRAEDVFTSYYSMDGEEWTQLGELTIDLPDNAYVGLALTSHNNSEDPVVGLVDAEFRNYQIVDTPHILNLETGAQISFDAHSPTGEINPESIRVTLNGIDRTEDLTITGTGGTVSATLNGLAENRFYVLDIEAADMTGLTATASEVFNTMAPEENFTWEANDWNFGGGQFFDDPGIDFADERNYFDRMGVDQVDEHTISEPGNDAYRLGSPVGTEAADDDPREPWASDTRPDAVQYNVGWVAIGEWLNYTRTFPAGEYYVYARLAFGGTGPFGAQLDRVTSDPSQPDQTTEMLGTFRRSTATGGWQDYVFVPLLDDNGNLVTVELDGVETLRVTAVEGGYNANYYMLLPADVRLPIIADLSPESGEVIDPADGVSFNIQSDAGVAREDIRLLLNGEDRTGDFTITGDENQWAVSFSNLQPGQSYILAVDVRDVEGNAHILLAGEPVQVAFETAVVIPGAFRTPPGSGRDPGFTVRVHNARDDAGGGALPNTIARAEQQLAGEVIDPETGEPFENLAIGEPGDQGDATFIETGVIAYDQDGNDVGQFSAEPFPGIPTGDPNFFAVEVTTYLELAEGLHRFGFRHDDGIRLTVGPFFEESTLELGMIQDWDQGEPSEPFEFLVEEAGVYAARLVMYEGEGGANLVWYSIADDGAFVLVNDPTDERAIQAFQGREGEPDVPEPVEGIPAPTIVWDGTNHVISWDDPQFSLERADEITGPWEALDVTSPHTAEDAEKRFYRLRSNAE